MVAALCIALVVSPTEQFEAIQSEWVAAVSAAVEARKAAEKKEMGAIFAKKKPDIIAYSRRFLALAEAHPDDPAARDALLWIVMREKLPGTAIMPGSLGISSSSELLGRAVDLLIEKHANDLQVARTALFLQNEISPTRDRFFRSLYEKSHDRVVKGTTTLALAQYLILKAKMAGTLRQPIPRPTVWEKYSTDEYKVQVRACDPAEMEAEAERLLERVITEFGDVPYARARGGETTVSDSGTSSRAVTEADLARKLTLAQIAEERHDEMHNLVVGKPAPEIDGVDFDGKPMKLSDYLGKVVVLVFWGSWCGPCMAQVPHERELVERLKEQPFALLGVDCDRDKGEARKVMERERMTWPSWFDGTPGEGPIVARYHIRGYPTVFVFDARGIIRSKNVSFTSVDTIIYESLKEVSQPSRAGSVAK
jgi:thiol-disulfide isomerase/thioredoxin